MFVAQCDTPEDGVHLNIDRTTPWRCREAVGQSLAGLRPDQEYGILTSQVCDAILKLKVLE